MAAQPAAAYVGAECSVEPRRNHGTVPPGHCGVTAGALGEATLGPWQRMHFGAGCPGANLISLKGEDILLTTPSTQMVRFHRLRASVPSRLWRWKVVTGWQWTRGKEHINSLEMRAILNAVRWRLEKQGHLGCRMLHLTDSLVCLHALTRGRTSSRKLRSTISRINALLLCSNSQMIWAYVATDSNPADKPSRWGRRVRSKPSGEEGG